MFTFKAAADSRTGNAHQSNEDSWWLPHGKWPPQPKIDQHGYLAILSDGVGGHAAGSTASRLAVETASQYYYTQTAATPAEDLTQALYAAQQQILQQAQQPGYKDMAATAVLALVQGNMLTLAHVGDSRAYLWRGGQLSPLTTDHSWVAEQLARGILTPAEAAEHPSRGMLSRALGMTEGFQPEVRQYAIEAGDRVLLCSDGVWDVLEPELANLLAQKQPRQIVKSLMNRVHAQQGQDDATAIVIAFDAPRRGILSNLTPKNMLLLFLPLLLLLLLAGSFLAGRFLGSQPDEVNADAVSSTVTVTATATSLPIIEPSPLPATPTATALSLPTSTPLPPSPPPANSAVQPTPTNPETQPQYCVAQEWQDGLLNTTYLIQDPDQSRYIGVEEMSPGDFLEGANPNMIRTGLADNNGTRLNYVQIQYQGQPYWLMANHLGTWRGNRCLSIGLDPAP